MKKRTILILAAVVLFMLAVILVSRWGAGLREEANEKIGIENPNAVTVTDFLGRQVVMPEKVERVGCLYAISGHVVAMLGKGEKIVAVVEGLKRDVLLNEMVPSIQQAVVPSVSGTINIEELMRAQPDIVFIRSETAKNQGELEKLQKAGIPGLVVDYRNCREQQQAIAMIGQVVGAGEKAVRYNEYYQNCISRVQNRVAGIPPEKKVTVFHSINEATRTDVTDTLPADILEIAGAVNVSIDQELKLVDDKHFASLEQILLWDPEVILVNEVGVVDYIMSNEQWSKLSAVKNRTVLQMPVGVSRWGHPGSLETPLAILWIAKTLYPEHFTDVDLVAETKEFYQQFFDYQLTDEAVQRILQGQGMRTAKGEKTNP